MPWISIYHPVTFSAVRPCPEKADDPCFACVVNTPFRCWNGVVASHAVLDVNELTVHEDAWLVHQRYLSGEDSPSSCIDASGLFVLCQRTDVNLH